VAQAIVAKLIWGNQHPRLTSWFPMLRADLKS